MDHHTITREGQEGGKNAGPAWIDVFGYLAQHFGLPHSKASVSYFAILEETGPLAQKIERLARRFGIEVRAVEANASGIKQRRLPMVMELDDGAVGLILSTGEGQARVIFGGDNGQWTPIALESLAGRIRLLLLARNGRTEEDERTSAYVEEKNDNWFRKAVFGDLRPYAYVMLATSIANILSLAGVLFSMQVYDRVVPANSMNTLYVLFIGVMLAVVFDFALRRVRSAIVDVVGKRADLQMSDIVFGHALRVKNQARPKSTGTFIAQLRDLEQVRELLTSTTVAAFADLPFFFLFLLVFWYIGGHLAVIPAVALLLLILPGLLVQGRLRKNATQAIREASLRNAMLVEAVQGLEDIKSLQAEKVFQQKWNLFNGVSADANLKLRSLTNGLTSWAHAVQTSIFAVIVFFGAPLVMEGDMTTGTLVACSILGSRMMAPMAQLANVLSRYQHARIGLKSLGKIMDMPVDHPPAETRISVGALSGRYDFRGATYFYGEPAGRAPLELKTLKIDAGQCVAVLGKNGAGKSTLLQAMSGLLEPASGEALVDNLAITQLDTGDLRREIGLLTQQSRLFYGTIRENVLLGAQNATQSMLLEALSLSGAESFIRTLPRGLDHIVDEGGRGLSGGQQQALLLSRLVVRGPSIVLLDEPTASMDEAAEKSFVNRFRRWSRGKTVIVATHRLRILDLADRVLVLEAGRIAMDAPKLEALRKLRREGAEEGVPDKASTALAQRTEGPTRSATKPRVVKHDDVH